MDGIHHVVCFAGSGFSVGPLSVLISGIWYTRRCRGTGHVFSPNGSVVCPGSIVFGFFYPKQLIKAMNCTQKPLVQICASICLFHFYAYKTCHLNASLSYEWGTRRKDVQLKLLRYVSHTMGVRVGVRGVNEEEWDGAHYRSKVSIC